MPPSKPELDRIPSELVELWSSRRALIESRQAELAAEFQTRHDRPPTPAEAIRLAQQATLETREAKHPPRSHEEQRRTWRAQAEAAIGAEGIGRALAHSLGRATTSRVDITEVLLGLRPVVWWAFGVIPGLTLRRR